MITSGINGSMGVGNLNDGKTELHDRIDQLKRESQTTDSGKKRKIEAEIQALINQINAVCRSRWF